MTEMQRKPGKPMIVICCNYFIILDTKTHNAIDIGAGDHL